MKIVNFFLKIKYIYIYPIQIYLTKKENQRKVIQAESTYFTVKKKKRINTVPSSSFCLPRLSENLKKINKKGARGK